MTKYVQKKGKHYIPTRAAQQIAQAPKNVYTLAKNPKKFWTDIALNEIDWVVPPKVNYKKESSGFSWFKDGKLNLCYNAVDRHLSNKPAIIFSAFYFL